MSGDALLDRLHRQAVPYKHPPILSQVLDFTYFLDAAPSPGRTIRLL